MCSFENLRLWRLRSSIRQGYIHGKVALSNQTIQATKIATVPILFAWMMIITTILA
jgi:hypothetical protein